MKFEKLVVNLLIGVAFILLVVGLYSPILTLEQFYLFSNTVSLWSALQTLAAESEWGLYALVGTFSVLFPILKILMLLLIWNVEETNSSHHKRHLAWLETYSKWSMLDVFVVALLVVTIKLGMVAQAHVEFGIYAFSASVVITMLVSTWIGKKGQVD